MRIAALALLASFAALALCSCGTLESDASFPKLKPEEMAYADALPQGNSDVMLQSYGKFQLKGSQSASAVYPCFPWLEVKSFFKDGSGYGLLYIYTLMPVVPLFVGTDGTIYTPDGEWMYQHHCSGIPLLYTYTELTKRYEQASSGREKDWQFDLVDFPYINGLLGFGSGNFQLLWIPFWTQDGSKLPKDNLDVDFKPGNDFR